MSEVIHVIRAPGNPTSAPQRAGQHWINVVDKRAYLSVGTSSVADWIEDDLAGHLAAADPHPQYETAVEAQAKVDAHANLTNNPHNVTKAQVGLGNVDNTSDLNKPVSTSQQAALDTKISTSLIGVANGVAPTGADNKIPAIYLPTYVDDVLEYANLAAFPVTGETSKIYIALDTNLQYRWSGSMYVPIAASPGTTDNVPEGAANLYFTTARVLATVLSGLSLATGGTIANTDSVLAAFGKLQKQITDNLTTLTNHINNISNPHAVTKTQVGLGNVQNVDTTTTTNVNEGTNLYFTEARVRSTLLTGFSLAVSTAVVAADSILVAIGKLQAQINSILTGNYSIITTVNYSTTDAVAWTSVAQLSLNLEAGKSYLLRYALRAQVGAANRGFSIRLVTPDTAVVSICGQAIIPAGIDAVGNAYRGGITSLGDQVDNTTSPAANQDNLTIVEALVVCTTSGSIVPQFRSSNAGINSQISANSVLFVRTT